MTSSRVGRVLPLLLLPHQLSALRAATDAAPSTRRRVLHAAAALAAPPLTLLPPRPALAGLFDGGGGPRVDVISSPSVCQGRCRDQDFVVVNYVGRRKDSGLPFDERYAQRPLTFELGTFYLPGVDEAIDGACVGTKLRCAWRSSPSLGTAEWDRVLPPGTPIELELELVSIRYSLFGEKMRNSASTYWFNPEPLTLTSAVDDRGHTSDRVPTVTKDNVFSIAPGEKSFISNPTGELGKLLPGLPF